MTSGRRPRRSARATFAIATAAVTLSAVALAGSAGAAPSNAESGMYLVQFTGAPIAAYAGGVNGIAATKPTPGAKLDPKAWNYGAYRDYLRAKRNEVLGKAKVDKKKTVAEYDTVVNGVAARLTGAEVAKLRATQGVVRVWKNEVVKLDTISTPRFLGLDGPNGAWARQFGDVSHAGEGTIIGVIDSGIWPESPSFAALPEPRPDADAIAAKWFGTCEPGDDPTEEPVTCNNKLIGARAYDLGSVPVADEDFHNARDFDGHGSHTASTAAGNNNVPAVINGVEIGRASGMAPAARIAAYKVCYELPDGSTANCGAIEAVAAIDDAVADGVDVINYSIGGSTGTITDLLHQAWFNAAAAGVFVSTSAGNSGPDPSTVAFNSPWTTTVAASTHDRQFSKSVTLGNGQTFTGAGVGPAVPSSPLIDSVSAGLAGADPTQVELCFENTLDPAKVTGKIVLCRRGVNDRIAKSLARLCVVCRQKADRMLEAILQRIGRDEPNAGPASDQGMIVETRVLLQVRNDDRIRRLPQRRDEAAFNRQLARVPAHNRLEPFPVLEQKADRGRLHLQSRPRQSRRSGAPSMASATASAVSMPSTAADMIPPAYPAPSPAG